MKYQTLLQIVTLCNNYLDSTLQNQLLQLKFDLLNSLQIPLCFPLLELSVVFKKDSPLGIYIEKGFS
jgi:hypothetical protein